MKQGWEIKKLGEITTKIGSGSTPRGGNESYKTEGISLVRSMNIHDYEFREKNLAYIDEKQAKELNNVTLQDNDVLLNITGASVARCCVIPKEYLPARVNQHVSIIRAIKEIIDPIFLNLLLTSKLYKDQLLFTGEQGATRQAITKAQLEVFEISFPKSLPEQQRIVAILDEAFAAIAKAKANAQQNLQNAKELFESYLQGVFENGNWDTKRLDEITDVKDGTHDSPKYIKEGIPFVTQKNIKLTGLTFEDTKFITDIDHEKFYKRSNVTFGDILISMIGANRGMATLVDDKRIFSIKNVGLIKSSNNINKHFLLYYLKSPLAMKYVLYMSNGGAQEFVGLTALRSFPIPFPPLKNQETIVQKLDALNAETKKLEAIYQQKINDLEELKKSVLQKAFSGDI